MSKKQHPSYPVSKIVGVDAASIGKLRAVRIRTTAGLLEAAKDAKGRKALADKTGIPVSDILKLVNQADLMRVKGLGGDYSSLLKDAGVDTLRALRHRNPQLLAKKMAEQNAKRRRLAAGSPVELLPGEKAIQKWIEQARALQIKITY